MRTAPSNEEFLRFFDSVMAEKDAAHGVAQPILTQNRADPGLGVLELCRFSITNDRNMARLR